jgi:long-chain acyl-CoA synthetase
LEAEKDLALAMDESINKVVIDGCDTVCGLFQKRVTEIPDEVVIREKDFGIWNEYTWGDFGEQARLTGLGLMALGLKRGDICSVASEINREWMFADLGICRRRRTARQGPRGS